LSIFLKLGERWAVAECLEELASALALDQPYRAASIWGAAERLREAIDAPRKPIEQARYDDYVAVARATFSDDAAFELAWRKGSAMDLKEVLRYALDEQAGGAKPS